MPPPPAAVAVDDDPARGRQADLGPHRYCVPCNVRWRGDEPCFSCDEPGLLRELTDPPGWPRLTILPAVAPEWAA